VRVTRRGIDLSGRNQSSHRMAFESTCCLKRGTCNPMRIKHFQ
jgi:hypothetical protein